MIAWWWSWLLTSGGLVGLFLAGRHDWRGWAIGLAVQVLWVAYALATQQYGFVLSAVAYGGVYYLNIWRWTHSEPDPESSLAPDGQRPTPR